MDIKEIENYITSFIEKALDGQDMEHPKLEFKREWYDLSDKNEGISKFVKDTSAMANTVGLDGFIVIGYDEKKKELINANFSDSKLANTAHLVDLINRHVDRAFDIRYYPITVHGVNLNVLHIPPSLDKPHVIRLHRSGTQDKPREERHRVYVRKNTKIEEATKYDLDLMYYDRKNILPDYQLFATLNLHSLRLPPQPQSYENPKFCIGFKGSIAVTFENTGRRPISIHGFEIHLDFTKTTRLDDCLQVVTVDLVGDPANKLIRSQDIAYNTWSIFSSNFLNDNLPDAIKCMRRFLDNKLQLKVRRFEVKTTNGIIIQPRFEQ